MEFRLLGPVEARRDDRPVALGGTKPRALLALLLLHANEVVSRDRIIEALWSDRLPGTAEHSLDVQISRLRKALASDGNLGTRSGGYVLEVDPEQIDARRFEQLLEEGRKANVSGEPEKALAVLDEALALWRGEVLGDLAYEEFARVEVQRLEELRLVATEERIDTGLALGRHDVLIPELDALTATHPLRERLRGQQMLALYRAGRQAEALRAYSDFRRRLVEELGIEPSSTLKELEHAILRQDPALGTGHRPVATPRRRLVAAALALALAGAVAAIAVGVTNGGTEGAQALAQADSDVFLTADGGDLVRMSPVRDTVRLVYDRGALWSVSSDGELTRLDPATGKAVATLGLGIKPAGLAVGEGSVWVTGRSSPTVYRVDTSVNELLEPFHLPLQGVETDLTGEVAVGAGSVWVGHGAFNPGAWLERLDAQTGRVQHRFSILAGDVDHLAFGEGAVWVASSPSGELRKIDPRTNTVVFKRTLQSELCCVAAGGGYVWVASNPEGVVWKVTTNGSVLPTIDLRSPVRSLTYADGAVWAALGDAGKAIRIDPTTNDTVTYDVGHSVTSVDVRHGLVAAGVRSSIKDVTGGLSGHVVWVGRKGDELFDSGAPTDPAFTSPTWDGPQEMFHYATCGRLLNHPDAEGDAGRRIVPDVAEDLPQVSDEGRTFTFRIRRGFRFSPPSHEEVSAASFQRALERDIELTRLFGDDLGPPFSNMVGAKEFYAREALHIAGVSARDDKLVLRFRDPEPDLPWLVATSSCAVPVDTPVVKGGLEKPVPSAGPYYLAALTDSLAVLRRNPNYGGSRAQHLDAIVVEFNVPPSEAATQIENGTLDYFLESQNATLTPDTAAARAAGNRYRLTPTSTAGVTFFAFNDDRPLFAGKRMRRAVQYALDRQTLVAAAGGEPATGLLSSGVQGYEPTQRYPVRSDLRTARRLAAGVDAPVIVYTWDDPQYDQAFNTALGEQLGAIGLHMRVIPIDQSKGFEPAKAARSDLVWGGLNANTADPAAYLRDLRLEAQDARELGRIQALFSPERERAAVALARKLDRASLFAVYRTDAIPELRSKRLGCVIHPPEYAGIDLTALCLRH